MSKLHPVGMIEAVDTCTSDSLKRVNRTDRISSFVTQHVNIMDVGVGNV